jgi:hypothetical protein
MKRYYVNAYNICTIDGDGVDYDLVEDTDGRLAMYDEVEAIEKKCEAYEKALKRIASNDGMGSVHPSDADPLRVIASEVLQSQRVG